MKTGRIGPPKTELDLESAYGKVLRSGSDYYSSSQSFDILGELTLDVEARSSFVSIRANTAIFKGRFYYEVTLLCDGLAQIGWC